jgi:hypothetical protein
LEAKEGRPKLRSAGREDYLTKQMGCDHLHSLLIKMRAIGKTLKMLV